MKFTIELTKETGLSISTTIPPIVLQVLVPLAAGSLTWPWLLDLARSLGIA